MKTRHDLLLSMIQEGTDACIIWPYATIRGYGALRLNGNTAYAHREALRSAVGDPPALDSHAAHSCRTPRCVNPRHLRWASPAENVEDVVKDGMTTKGERNHHARLSFTDVIAIREARRTGSTLRQLSEAFDISISHACGVSKGRFWKHV